MRYDTIVIAGTTESREVIVSQLEKNHTVLACVATDLGAQMLESYDIDVHIGRLDEAGFTKLFLEHPCGAVIDASHPFAKVVTETVKTVTKNLEIPYERYEREQPVYDYDRIAWAADAADAAAMVNETEGPVLLTTGVNTCGVYAGNVTAARERLYIRVLDTPASYEGCAKAGYPRDHVVGEMPPFSVEQNLRLIRETGARVMVTKDSGETGGEDKKVEACRRAGIDLILIRRPGE